MRVLLLLALVLLAGCDGNDLQIPARVRAVHAASATGALDFLIDFDELARGLTFRNASAYVEWEPGLRRLDAQTTQNGVLVSASRDVVLEEDRSYSVVVAGTQDAASLVLLQDDRSPPGAGLAQIRLVHGAERAPTVAALVAPEAGGSPVLDAPALSFGSATATVLVAAGSYQFLLSSGDGNATLTATLEAGRRYLAVAAHVADTAALSLFLVTDG